MNHLEQLYVPRLVRIRELAAHSGIARAMLDEDVDPRLLERFLIEYCSLGVQMTEPVEGWIGRAGRRCVEVGLYDVGSMLMGHAVHEAGHHLMFMEDTRKLLAHWNARCEFPLVAERLFARAPTRAMRHYIALHEETIDGPMPFAQIAIEFEIERLSVVLVPALLAHVERILGSEVSASLGFLRSHAELDVGHTHLNARMMETLLSHRAEDVGDLARIGAEALLVYMAFFGECWRAAVREVARGPRREAPSAPPEGLSGVRQGQHGLVRS
jgi:hypothetical protein